MTAPPAVAVPTTGDWEERTRAGFAGQAFMGTIGAALVEVVPGAVSVRADFDPRLTQQHGFVHGGILATLADTAAGFAALTLMPAELDILTAGFTINLLRPGRGRTFTASATVLKHGRRLTVCQSRVTGDQLCAVATVTLAAVPTTPPTAATSGLPDAAPRPEQRR